MTTTEDIYTWNIEDLWNEFKRLHYEGEVDTNDFNKAKYGQDIPFDIRFHLMNERGDERIVRMLPKTGLMKVVN